MTGRIERERERAQQGNKQKPIGSKATMPATRREGRIVAVGSGGNVVIQTGFAHISVLTRVRAPGIHHFSRRTSSRHDVGLGFLYFAHLQHHPLHYTNA